MGGIDPSTPTPSEGGSYGGGDWISALIGAGTAIYTTVEQKKAQERQNKANRELAKYQYDLNTEAWNAQNAYNTPQSQMDRFRQAGLNPSLMYGSGAGGGGSGNASQYPQYNAPRMEQEFAPLNTGGMMGMLSQYQEFRMRQAQIDNVRAQTANVNSRTATESLRPDLLGLQKETGQFDLDTKTMLRPYNQQMGEQAAQQSKYKTTQEWQKIGLMSQEQQKNLLNFQLQKRNIEGQQLTNELRASQVIFQRYRNQWQQAGVTSSDNPLLRLFVRQLGEAGILDTFSQGMASFRNRNRQK